MERGSLVEKKKKRGRPVGVDQQKLAKIVRVLAENPEGLWLRRIALKAGLHPTTVGNCVDRVLRPIVEDVSLGSDDKPIMRVIRLKPFVLKRIDEGASLRQILQLSQVFKDVEGVSRTK